MFIAPHCPKILRIILTTKWESLVHTTQQIAKNSQFVHIDPAKAVYHFNVICFKAGPLSGHFSQLVIASFFFFLKALEKNMKYDTTSVRMGSGDHLGDSKKRYLASSYLTNRHGHRQKRSLLGPQISAVFFTECQFQASTGSLRFK